MRKPRFGPLEASCFITLLAASHQHVSLRVRGLGHRADFRPFRPELRGRDHGGTDSRIVVLCRHHDAQGVSMTRHCQGSAALSGEQPLPERLRVDRADLVVGELPPQSRVVAAEDVELKRTE